MYIARTVRPRFDLARRRRARCTRARAVGVLETPSPPSPSSETHRQAKPSGDSIRNIQVLPFFYLPGPRRCTHRIEESEHARSPSRQPRPLCRFDAAGRPASEPAPVCPGPGGRRIRARRRRAASVAKTPTHSAIFPPQSTDCIGSHDAYLQSGQK
jgi:hypothetical protein